MSMYVMNRDFKLSHMGHSLIFREGVPIHVPPICRAEARKYGAVLAEGETEDLAEEMTKKPEFATAADEPQGDDRENRLLEAIDYLVKENKPHNFGGNGAPKIVPIFDLVHFRIDSTERNRVWTLYNQRKQAAKAPSNQNTAPNPDKAVNESNA